MNLLPTQPGYTALVAVLIVGAIGTTIATTLLEGGLNSSRIGTTREYAALSRSLNQQCLEKSLYAVSNQNSYTGTLTLTSDLGTCTSTVSNKDASNKIITTTSTTDTVTRVTNTTISNTNPITIYLWQEMQ